MLPYRINESEIEKLTRNFGTPESADWLRCRHIPSSLMSSTAVRLCNRSSAVLAPKLLTHVHERLLIGGHQNYCDGRRFAYEQRKISYTDLALTDIVLMSDSCPVKVCLHVPSLMSHSWTSADTINLLANEWLCQLNFMWKNVIHSERQTATNHRKIISTWWFQRSSI